MQYDPTFFETWRPNFEMRQSLAWFGGIVIYMLYGMYTDMTGATIGCQICCAGMGLWKFRQAVRRFHMTMRLAGTPLPFVDFEELKRIINDPVHKKDMWLGKGFAWGPTQTKRITELLKRDWHRTYKEALGAFYVTRFLKKHLWLTIFRPFKALHIYKEEQKRVSDAQGQQWIHGVGDGENDIFQPVSHSEGHTLIIGTTGSGKTRCFDLLISQCILRNETVFIIDPKGDRDLRDKAKRACDELGRGDRFVSFHPAHPQSSIRINLLANWTRPSEIASRISALMQSGGNNDNDPFKNFAFGALNAVCSGLCNVYRSPTLKNLKHYLAGTSVGLVVEAINSYLRKANPDKVPELEKSLQNLKKKDPESIANALVEFYLRNGPSDADMDDLVNMFTHNREHFSKMITSLLPILTKLTSGVLGDMLSPNEELGEQSKNEWSDTNELIRGNYVVYVGLDSLSDTEVGQAIGSMFLSDLACVAGARYNFEDTSKGRTVNIFVDEAAEVVNQPFLQILNKGRGAKLKLFVATQTYSDFVAKMGSKDKATQLLGNLNNKICLRCIDPQTQQFVTDSLPKTKIQAIQRTRSVSMNSSDPIPSGGQAAERLAEEEVPIFTPELLGMLPNLEFIATLSGGHIYKGRYPLILKSKAEFRG